MSVPAAKGGDRVVGLDMHVVLVQGTPTTMPLPFEGELDEALSQSVLIEHQAAAVVGSVAHNSPQHIPMGGSFLIQPSNRGVISSGSTTVFIEHKPMARMGDPAKCCNDPVDQDTGHVVADSTILLD